MATTTPKESSLRHAGAVTLLSGPSGATRFAKLTFDSLSFFHDENSDAPDVSIPLISARAKVGSDPTIVEIASSNAPRVEFSCASADQAKIWLAELNASTSLLPLGKSPSTLTHSQRRATSIKSGRLQYRANATSAAFKPSQVALVEEQMTVTFVDRSQPEIVVPLRKKTVVRQAPNGGDGEFLVDKHCFKGSALEMHDWIDAISTVAQRSKNRRSGTVEPGAADHEPVDATSSDDGEDDSSSSSASGTRRRKTQVTRRRQVHGSIADAAAADDGAPKRAADKRRSLTHSQATVIGEGAVAAAGNDGDHDDHAQPGTSPDDDGSSSSSSTIPRSRAKLKKRESDGSDLLLLEATLYLKVSKKSWKPRRAVLTTRHLTLFDGSATTPSERYSLQFGSVSVQAMHAGGGRGGDNGGISSSGAFSSTMPVSSGAGNLSASAFSSTISLAAATSASDNDTDERRWVLQFAAEGKRIELAAADEKTVQQWADAIASACDDLRTRASTDSSMASSHPRFDMGSDGSLSMSSKLRLHHAAEDAAAATSGDDGSDGRAASEPRVLREGWLHRKGETIMFGSAYKKKWAVLDTMLLRFYDSEKDTRKSGAVPVATIALAFASVKVAADKKSGESKYHFDLYSGQKRHELYAETEVSRAEWTEAIQSVASALITAAAAGGDKRDPVFGVPLALVMDGQRDTHGSLAIPYAMHRLLQAFKSHNGAKTERIFRVEPDAAALAQYRLAFEEHRFEAEPADAHVAAALLKAYIAELPTPLFGKRLSDQVFDVVSFGFNDGDAALQRVIGVIERIEEPTRSVVVALVEVLGEVCHPDRVEYSKMPADKLADVFTPLLVGARFYDKLHDDDDRIEQFLRALISGARTLTRRLGVAEAATESAPASYLRGINGRPVVHEGWLMKRGRLRTKKRWVILDERALYIFDAPEEKWPPKETLDLAGATAVAVEGSRTRFSFRAAGNAKEGETEFEASSGQELEMWLSAVQWKIKLSSGERAPAADVSKVTHADAKEALRARGNDVCCDCATPAPALCSVDKGVLLCTACAELHKAAMPSSEIKSLLELPNGWSPNDIQTLKCTGNGRANDRFEANLEAHQKPTQPDASYVRRKWVERVFAMSEAAQAILAAVEQVAPLRTLLDKLMQDEAFVRQCALVLAKHEAADEVLGGGEGSNSPLLEAAQE